MASPNQVTEYSIPFSEFIGGAGGDTYDLALDHPLLADHFFRLPYGNQDDGLKADEADEGLVRVIPPIAGATTVTLKRTKAIPVSAIEIVLRLVECTDNTSPEGFKLRGAHELVFAAGDSIMTSAHSGVVDSGQVQVISAGVECETSNWWEKARGMVRLRHTATDVEASRVSAGSGLTATAYIIEWGVGVVVELVEFNSLVMTAGGDLSSASNWETKAISSVVSENAFLSATFATNQTSQVSNYAESLVCVLGNGLSVGVNEAEIAVGSFEGGRQVDGWIYIVSHANWYVARYNSAHGSFVGFGTVSRVLDISPPSGAEVYSRVNGVDQSKGSRFVRSNQSVESEFTNHFFLSQHTALLTSETALSYSRGSVESPPDALSGDGFFAVEIVDFNGSPFGDPNDIDGTTSSALAGRTHSVIADGDDTSKVTVTVKDSASKIVVGVPVTLKIGTQSTLSGTTDVTGRVDFMVTSNVSGLQGSVISMGIIPVSLVLSPQITFAAIPTNWTNEVAVNLGTLEDFAAGDPFIDLMLAGRAAEVLPFGGGSHVEAKENFDTNGWQMSAVAGVDVIQYYIATNDAKDRGAGNYIIDYDPAGFALEDFSLASAPSGGATITNHVLGRMEIAWDGSALFGPRLKSSTTDATPANYPKDFTVLHEDDHAAYNRAVNIWRPEFLASVQYATHFRFMDWGTVNNNPLVSWADRPTATTQCCNRVMFDNAGVSRKIGVPYEFEIDLCNRIGADAYICIPHMADDNYVTQTATIWRDGLNEGLRVHFEFSNEVWNPQFTQTGYRETLRIGYGIPDSNAGRHAAGATRACEMFALIDAVFGTRLDRRRRNLAGQSGNPTSATEVAGADVSTGTNLTGIAAEHADIYEIAPYGGRTVIEATAQAAFDALEADMDVVLHPTTGEVALTRNNLNALSTVLPIGCYEAGFHLTPQGVQTEQIVRDANQLPDIRRLTKKYMDLVSPQVDGPVYWFELNFKSGASGAWGLFEKLSAAAATPGPLNYKWYGYLDWVNQAPLVPSESVWSNDDVVSRGFAFQVSDLGPGEFFDFEHLGYKSLIFGVDNISSGVFVDGDLEIQDLSKSGVAISFESSAGGVYTKPTALALGQLQHPPKMLRIVNNGSSTLDALIGYRR